MTSSAAIGAPIRKGRSRAARPPSFLRAHALELFVVIEFACQLALLSSSIGQFRSVVRITMFGSSILALLMLAGRGETHPAAGPMKLVLLIVSISIFHPNTNTVLAGAAQIGMYFAIAGPLFWVPRLEVSTAYLRRVLMIIWLFQTVSAATGILQVYFPGHFEPALATVTINMGKAYLTSLRFRNAFGQLTWRAMGLTDTPGGAAGAGFYAALLGTAFVLILRGIWTRSFAALTLVIGMIAIYLSKNRSMFVMLGICEVGVTVLLGMRRSMVRIRPEWRRIESGGMVRLLSVLALSGFLSLSWAVSIGGSSVADRFGTLIAEHPAKVYGKNRGHFIQSTVEQMIPQYPLGAGLGRWGMMNYYFGDSTNPNSRSIWAEEQWTGWVLDGGLPMIFAYVLAIMFAIRTAFRLSIGPVEPELAIFGAIICGYDIGAFADCFNYGYFMSQGGLEFWLLNAALYAAYVNFRKNQHQQRSTPVGYASKSRLHQG